MARVNIDGKNNKEWDSRLVDAYMKNQSKQNNNRSTAQSRCHRNLIITGIAGVKTILCDVSL